MTEHQEGAVSAAPSPDPLPVTPAYCDIAKCRGGEVCPSLGGDRTDVDSFGPWLTGPVKRDRKPVNSRNKGLTAERQLANYLVSEGWPDARRSVSTGWTTKGRKYQDQGDIAGTPGLCFQLKNVANPPNEGAELTTWFRDATDQALPDRLPLLVVKRLGRSDPADWHLWVRVHVLIELEIGMPHEIIPANYRVRVELGRVIDKLLTYSRSREDKTG